MRRSLCIIAGGTGSGKTTVAETLVKKYPHIALVHMDDYFYRLKDTPTLPNGNPNWDHPDAIQFDLLVGDIMRLLDGVPITVQSKHLPDYDPLLMNRTPVTIQPKPVVLLEGHLALFDPRLRKQADFMAFLTMPIAESAQRRTGNKMPISPEYVADVLTPMHHAYVEPTSTYAHLVIDVSFCEERNVFKLIEHKMKAKRLLS